MTKAHFQGDTLRERREELGLSLYEASRQTHISVHNIQAIEEGNFAVLPGECYSVGFVRTYCAQLGLDPEPYIDDVRACMRVPSTRFLRRQPGVSLPQITAPAWFQDVLAWALVMGVVVLGWFAYSAVVGTHNDATETRVEAGSNELVLPPTPTESDF